MLRNGLVLADRQDTGGSEHLTVANNECTVMQGGILKENILYQSCRYLCIETLTGIDYFFEAASTGYDNESTGFGGRHMTASLSYFQNLLARPRVFAIGLGTEYRPGRKARTNAVEEHTYLFLENDDEGYRADRDDAVEERAGEVQFEDKAHEEPYYDEGENTPEEVRRSRTAQQAVGIIQDTRHEQDINHIFETERES